MVRLSKWLVIALATAFLMASAPQALSAEVKGKIKNFKADRNEFVVTDTSGQDWNFQMKEDATITLADKGCIFAELNVGDDVTVTYENRDGKFWVSKISSERRWYAFADRIRSYAG
jgi:hypothetical protein